MFLGIDGGGTKTAFLLLDAHGRERARAEGGSSYHPEVGIDGVRAVLETGIREVLARAGVPASAVSCAFVGLPAYGEDPRVDPVLATTPGVALPADRFLCGNDMVCSWAGGLGCEDGVSVIAGTGSIAYGEYAGRSARAGGWGEVFGDEGSAFWIAREGLGLFSRMSDGRCAAGPLLELVRQHYALERDLDLAGLINDPASAARAALAQLSRLVAAAAVAGDTACRDLYGRAGQELASLVRATRGRLDVPVEVPLAVSYSGGVFATGALLLDPFGTALSADGAAWRLQAPRFSPVVGAALYAARLARVRFTGDQLAQLERTARAPAGP